MAWPIAAELTGKVRPWLDRLLRNAQMLNSIARRRPGPNFTKIGSSMDTSLFTPPQYSMAFTTHILMQLKSLNKSCWTLPHQILSNPVKKFTRYKQNITYAIK
jgi:hypothetical protein